MSGELLLDTNVVIALISGEPAASARIAQASSVFLPVFALGELYYGAEKSARVADNVDRVRQFAAAIAVLSCDAATAREYGRVKELLRAKGRPLPENDIWIGAMALQHGLTLASRDHHFHEIPGLAIDRCD